MPYNLPGPPARPPSVHLELSYFNPSASFSTWSSRRAASKSAHPLTRYALSLFLASQAMSQPPDYKPQGDEEEELVGLLDPDAHQQQQHSYPPSAAPGSSTETSRLVIYHLRPKWPLSKELESQDAVSIIGKDRAVRRSSFPSASGHTLSLTVAHHPQTLVTTGKRQPCPQRLP